uniref:Sugar phosphate transporter domain-containing protein n=1 Tax=Oryza brachyantha TaxID=4533 RepID=J3NAJ7_ORYBR
MHELDTPTHLAKPRASKLPLLSRPNGRRGQRWGAKLPSGASHGEVVSSSSSSPAPAPSVLLFCASLAVVLVRPRRPTPLRRLRRAVVPIGVMCMLSFWFSNSAYIYLSVSFIQMLKALMPVAVYSLVVAFRTDSFRPA